MDYSFVFYPDPLNTLISLRSDDGFTGTGTHYTDPSSGRQGQRIIIPGSVVSEHGAELTLSLNGYDTTVFRGLLELRGDGKARLQIDDFHLKKSSDPVEPPDNQQNPNADAFQIIQYVYESTLPNLSTKAGCGKFTEDCCEELHLKMNRAWGHIRKEPAQNQFNGHAVDAIMLLVPSGPTPMGTYDIIQSSEAPDARPSFNLVDAPNPSLWFYPASPISGQSIHSARTNKEKRN